VRLYLESDLKGDAESVNECQFGRGRHSCLGEDLSNWMWRALSGELAQLPLRFTIERAARRTPDWVFRYYAQIVVDFHV
jgi:hypothetical protein